MISSCKIKGCKNNKIKCHICLRNSFRSMCKELHGDYKESEIYIELPREETKIVGTVVDE